MRNSVLNHVLRGPSDKETFANIYNTKSNKGDSMQGICASGAEGPVMLWAPPLLPAFAAEGPKYRNLVSDFWPIIMNSVNKNEAKIVKSENRRTFY